MMHMCCRTEDGCKAWRRFLRLMTAAAIVAVLILSAALPFELDALPVSAAELQSTYWVRAAFSITGDRSLSGLSEEMIVLSEKWSRQDGYYYYTLPVSPGETIELMRGVRVPAEWKNESADRPFSILITVDVAEMFPGDESYASWSGRSFTQSYETSLENASRSGLTVTKGSIKVTLNEFEKTETGEQPYRNGRTVVPGETVSKIVRITVDGTPSQLNRRENSKVTPAKTGDESLLFVPVFLMAACLLMLIAAMWLLIWARRSSREDSK